MDPMSEDFDPFNVVEWSPDFAAAHHQAMEASVSGEFDPALIATRSAFVTLQNLYHSATSRGHLLDEKKKLSSLLNQCRAELGALRLDHGKALSANDLLTEECLKLKDEVTTERAEKAEMTRTRKWENTRFGYRCFRNVVDQLRLLNPCLDTVGICSNKFAFGDTIRDLRPETDPPEPPYPPMPENYGTDDYTSGGDDDFPCYRDFDEGPGGPSDPFAGGE